MPRRFTPLNSWISFWGSWTIWSVKPVMGDEQSNLHPPSQRFNALPQGRATDIFLENWRYFKEEGVPRLNVVDPKLGY